MPPSTSPTIQARTIAATWSLAPCTTRSTIGDGDVARQDELLVDELPDRASRDRDDGDQRKERHQAQATIASTQPPGGLGRRTGGRDGRDDGRDPSRPRSRCRRRASRPRRPARSAMRATLSAVRPAAVTEVGPTNVAIPTVDGSGIIGRTRRTIPPRARKPHRATIQSAGRSPGRGHRPRERGHRSAGAGRLRRRRGWGTRSATRRGTPAGEQLEVAGGPAGRARSPRPYVAKSPARSAAWASSKWVFA